MYGHIKHPDFMKSLKSKDFAASKIFISHRK